MTIIGISGFAGAGKDTVGQILVEHHGFTRVAFADKLKTLAAKMDPILPVWHDDLGHHLEMRLSELIDDYSTLNAAKLAVPAVREYLQALGVNVREVLGDDTWVRAALSEYRAQRDEARLAYEVNGVWEPENLPRVVVTDVRFRNEADAIVAGGGYVWRVERPGVGPANDHISEHDLDGYGFDAYVTNHGTIDDLQVLVAALVNSEVLS